MRRWLGVRPKESNQASRAAKPSGVLAKTWWMARWPKRRTTSSFSLATSMPRKAVRTGMRATRGEPPGRDGRIQEVSRDGKRHADHPWMQTHLGETRGFTYRSICTASHKQRDRIYGTSLLLRDKVRFTSACSLLSFLRSVPSPLVCPTINIQGTRGGVGWMWGPCAQYISLNAKKGRKETRKPPI